MRPFLIAAAVAVLSAACALDKAGLKGAKNANGLSTEVDGPKLAYAAGEDMAEPDIRTASYQAAPELRTVYFEYDQYGLSNDGLDILKANAAWLKRHPELLVLVEGHADEKGTAEYNLALGQKRAKTAREYYLRDGVDPKQVGTISYGKEQPDCTGDYDTCAPKNRRAVTKVAAKK